jgi:D-arabinose 1-dehydrogenase-like Zn-dependent alcohol dehydrogenase
MTRVNVRGFLELAAKIDLKPADTSFTLDEVTDALRAVKDDRNVGAAVMTM